MTDDDWWAQAVDEFGLEPSPQAALVPSPAADSAPDDGDPTEPDAALVQQRRRRRSRLVDWLVVGTVSLGAALLLRQFVVQQFAVDGESMLGSLHTGDRVIVNKLSYRLHDPRHGDIVVLEDLNGSVAVRDLIKRVVALPGETIEYRDCQLLLDSEPVSEPYLDPALVGRNHCGADQPAVVVEPDHVFVMGDNRDSSLDSRTPAIGQVPFDHLIGRAFVIVWPFSDLHWL